MWHYQDFGLLYYDQCSVLASEHGAMIITPYTIGLSGDNYWISQTHQCNTYEYIDGSGFNLGYENAGYLSRSTQRYVCHFVSIDPVVLFSWC